MGLVDRTVEFQQLVQKFSAKELGSDVECANRAAPRTQSELNALSAQIGTQVHQASLKVQDLRRMAKSKNIFNDKSFEIEELTLVMKKDIHNLNQKIEALEAKAKGVGPNRNYQIHASNMVQALKMRWLEVTKEFQEALADRTRALEEQAKRKGLYSIGTTSAFNPLRQNEFRVIGHGDDLEDGGAVAMDQRIQTSRVNATASVQRTIGEVTQIFQKMTALVHAQEEQIQCIDEDVNDTLRNVEEAQDHLLRQFHHISSNRWLIIKVFLILIFFVVFFIVFLA